MNRLAEKIKKARLNAKLTEKELAKKCGLSVNYIIQIESGKKDNLKKRLRIKFSNPWVRSRKD